MKILYHNILLIKVIIGRFDKGMTVSYQKDKNVFADERNRDGAKVVRNENLVVIIIDILEVGFIRIRENVSSLMIDHEIIIKN